MAGMCARRGGRDSFLVVREEGSPKNVPFETCLEDEEASANVSPFIFKTEV